MSETATGPAARGTAISAVGPGVFFELTIRDEGPDRAVAAIWGVSSEQFFRILKPRLEGRGSVLFGFGAGRHIERWLLPAAGPDVVVAGPRDQETVLARGSTYAETFQSDHYTWAVCGALAEEPAPNPPPAPLYSLDGLPFAHSLSFAYDCGGLVLRGSRQEVEELAGLLFAERLAGPGVPLVLPVWLFAQARSTGLLLYRALIDRGAKEAVLLHASGLGGVKEVSIGPGSVREASGANYATGKLQTRPLPPLSLSRRLKIGRIRLWLGQRVLQTGDGAWV